MDIADFPALAPLSDAQLENLRAACEERVFAPGDEIMRRGTEGGKLYFLLEGTAEVYAERGDSEVLLSQLEAPAVVGELELLTEKPRSASVRATTAGRALAISNERLLARIEEGDTAVLKTMFAVSRIIAHRLVRMSDKFIELEARADPSRKRELRDFRQKLFSDWSV